LGFGSVLKLLVDPGYFLRSDTYQMFHLALIPIVYGGIFSVGIAYSLQVYAQKKAHPTIAALILCSESLFALFGGWLILKETVSFSMLLGALVLLLAMIINLLPSL
jgi:drug/metabolite transporter (DMT)-like permease